MKAIFLILFLSCADRISAQSFFIPDAPFVGEINGSYIDPEFNATTSQVVFQDARNTVWIGDIDKETGLFRSASGRDYLMDTNINPVFDTAPRKWSTNGPEWTKDARGHFVVYTKQDSAGLMQQWMARLVDGRPEVKQLTHQPMDCYGNMPSRFDDGRPPRIAFTYNWPIWEAEAAWSFADAPDSLYAVPYFDYRRMSMWSPVSPDFLFVHQPPGATYGQIARSNAETGAMKILTNDAGKKDDPGFFRAPEFGGDVCLLANVDNSALALYRDLGAPDGFWTRVATLRLPDDVPYKYISSPEIIAAETGINGVSYFALLARERSDRDSPGGIWVMGLGTDSTRRLVRRIDDGALTATSAVRLEPEPFVGTREVYVYYNFYSPSMGQHGLRRAATGIHVNAVSSRDSDNETTRPHDAVLRGAHPNPFHHTTNITYEIPTAGNVTLTVHDVLGRRIATLVEGWKDVGSHVVPFHPDARDHPPGVYVCVLRSGGFILSQTMVKTR